MAEPFFKPGKCYRRGDQMMRVLGPLFPTFLPEAERGLWHEVSEEEWNAALARRTASEQPTAPTATPDGDACR